MTGLRTHRIAVLAIGLVLSVLATSRARADTGVLVIGGTAQEHERLTVGGAIESAVRGAGWTLSAKPTKKESDGILNCRDATTPWTCVPPSISSKGIREVFAFSVEMTQAPNGAPLVVITGRVIVMTPPEFAFGQKFCEHCADDKLTEAGAELARQLLDDLATRTGRTVAHFTSAPSGADIILDGARLGATEATYSTYPGKHTAMVQKAGYVSQVREFTVESGKTADLTFTLVPSDSASVHVGPTTPTPKSQRSYLLPGVAIGAGTTLAVLGGVLLYHGLSDDPHYEYTRAKTVGVPFTLVGLGAIGTGVYLLWRSDRASAPSAAIVSGGAVVGWTGRF